MANSSARQRAIVVNAGEWVGQNIFIIQNENQKTTI
jgi:hypothetical protein